MPLWSTWSAGQCGQWACAGSFKVHLGSTRVGAVGRAVSELVMAWTRALDQRGALPRDFEPEFGNRSPISKAEKCRHSRHRRHLRCLSPRPLLKPPRRSASRPDPALVFCREHRCSTCSLRLYLAVPSSPISQMISGCDSDFSQAMYKALGALSARASGAFLLSRALFASLLNAFERLVSPTA
eukprot:scaffold116545_cov96-Phaeocystis_antarctica.AAC.3